MIQVNGTEEDKEEVISSPLQSPGEIENMTVVDEVSDAVNCQLMALDRLYWLCKSSDVDNGSIACISIGC